MSVITASATTLDGSVPGWPPGFRPTLRGQRRSISATGRSQRTGLIRRLTAWANQEREEALRTAPVWRFAREEDGSYRESRVR